MKGDGMALKDKEFANLFKGVFDYYIKNGAEDFLNSESDIKIMSDYEMFIRGAPNDE